MTKTITFSDMMVTALEIQLQHLRTEADDIMFRRRHLEERARDVNHQIEQCKREIANHLNGNAY